MNQQVQEIIAEIDARIAACEVKQLRANAGMSKYYAGALVQLRSLRGFIVNGNKISI